MRYVRANRQETTHGPHLQTTLQKYKHNWHLMNPNTPFYGLWKCICRSVPLADVNGCWAIVHFETQNIIPALPADRVHVHLRLCSSVPCLGSPPYTIGPRPALGPAPALSVKASALILTGPNFGLCRLKPGSGFKASKRVL